MQIDKTKKNQTAPASTRTTGTKAKKVWQSVPKAEKVCKKVQKCMQVCESEQKCAKVRESTGK